jgi:hypothetical protein
MKQIGNQIYCTYEAGPALSNGVLGPSSGLLSWWRWRQQCLPKRRWPITSLHGVITQKTSTWILITVKISYLSCSSGFLLFCSLYSMWQKFYERRLLNAHTGCDKSAELISTMDQHPASYWTNFKECLLTVGLSVLLDGESCLKWSFIYFHKLHPIVLLVMRMEC